MIDGNSYAPVAIALNTLNRYTKLLAYVKRYLMDYKSGRECSQYKTNLFLLDKVCSRYNHSLYDADGTGVAIRRKLTDGYISEIIQILDEKIQRYYRIKEVALHVAEYYHDDVKYLKTDVIAGTAHDCLEWYGYRFHKKNSRKKNPDIRIDEYRVPEIDESFDCEIIGTYLRTVIEYINKYRHK